MNAIEDNVYQGFLDEIENMEDWLEGVTERIKDLCVDRQKRVEKIKDFEEACEIEKANIFKINLEEKTLMNDKRNKEVELAQQKQSLASQIHSDKLKALISEQIPFEEALRGQVKAFSDSRLSGLSFEDSSENLHEAISDEILRMISSNGFSQPIVEWRGAKALYNLAIEKLCEKRLKGIQITAQEAQSRFDEIIRILRVQETRLFK